MSSWRAGCGGTRTSGSGVRAGETDHPKGGTALRSDTHYWAADWLAEHGASVHLAHPLGNNWGHRRVKNDQRDAEDLADLYRLGRLAEAWVAPPAVRQLRELVRYRAKLVALRSGLKAQAHAVLAKERVSVPVTDLFGKAGRKFLDDVPLAAAYRARIESLRGLISTIDREVAIFERDLERELGDVPGYAAIQKIAGVGPVIAAIFVAEIGDVTRFASPRHLASWAGLTPRHRESDPTPRSTAARSPSRAAGSSGGRPSEQHSDRPPARSSEPTTHGSQRATGRAQRRGRSLGSPSRDGSSRSSTTA